MRFLSGSFMSSRNPSCGLFSPSFRPRSQRMGKDDDFYFTGPPWVPRYVVFVRFYNKLETKPKLPDFAANLSPAPNGQLLNIYTGISDSRCRGNDKPRMKPEAKRTLQRTADNSLSGPGNATTNPPMRRSEEAGAGLGSTNHQLRRQARSRLPLNCKMNSIISISLFSGML